MKINDFEIEVFSHDENEVEVGFGDTCLYWKKNMKEISVSRNNDKFYKNVSWQELTLEEQTLIEMFV